MLIAHFSDFHIHNDIELGRALAMVRHALVQNVDHLVISGDLVDAAETKLVERFRSGLRQLGWASSDRTTYALGNHDVFPLPGKLIPGLVNWPKLTRPTANANRVLEITKSSRTGRGCTPLVTGEEHPVGKVLSDDVAIVVLDTIRRGQYNPQRWGEGELPKSHMQAVNRFFKQHSHTRHRIIALHHTPWRENIDKEKLMGQNFVEPPPETIMSWLETSGATLVLCGHIHCCWSIEKRPFGKNGIILRAGTAGGMHEGDSIRVYHVIDLPAKAQQTIRGISLTGSQLDAMQPVHEPACELNRL